MIRIANDELEILRQIFPRCTNRAFLRHSEMRPSGRWFNTVYVKNMVLFNVPFLQMVCWPLVFLSQPLLLVLIGDNWRCSSPASCLAHHIVEKCCLPRIIELFTKRNFMYKH